MLLGIGACRRAVWGLAGWQCLHASMQASDAASLARWNTLTSTPLPEGEGLKTYISGCGPRVVGEPLSLPDYVPAGVEGLG